MMSKQFNIKENFFKKLKKSYVPKYFYNYFNVLIHNLSKKEKEYSMNLNKKLKKIKKKI